MSLISKTNKNLLKNIINFRLSDINNKIVSYKNIIRIPKDKLKDFMSAELILFIPKWLEDSDTLKENLYTLINYLKKYKIQCIDFDKLLKTIEEMKIKKENDKVILLTDRNNNLVTFYIKMLNKISYKFDDIAFVLNLQLQEAEKIVENFEFLNRKIKEKNENELKAEIIVRSGIYEVYYNDEDTWEKIEVFFWVDSIYLSLLK